MAWLNDIEGDIPEVSEEELDQLDAELAQSGIDMADVMKETLQAPASDGFDFPIDYSDPNKDMGYANGIMQDYTGALPDELEGKTRKSEEIGFEQLGEFYPEDLEEDSPLTRNGSVQQNIPQEKKPTPAPKAPAPKPVPTRKEPVVPTRTEVKMPPVRQTPIKTEAVNTPPVKAESVKQETQVTAPKVEPMRQQYTIFKKIADLRDEINKTGKTWTDSKEFRKFRDALNKSADAIAKRKPNEPPMKPEDMDKMLQDISTAADNYYFAKLGQSHNARRNQRFDIAAQARDFMQQAREGLKQENKPIKFSDDGAARNATKLADKMFYAKSEQNNKVLLQGDDHAAFFRQSKDFAKTDSTFRWMMNGDSSQFMNLINMESNEVGKAYQGQDALRTQAELRAKQNTAPEKKAETVPAPKNQEKETLYSQLVDKTTGALLQWNRDTTNSIISKAGGMEPFKDMLKSEMKLAYQGKDTPEFLKARIDEPNSRKVENFKEVHQAAKEHAKKTQNPNPTVNKELNKQSQTKQASGFIKG